MGEKIKTLINSNLLGAEIEVEINKPVISGTEELVHIQTEDFRFELGKSNFEQFAIGLLLAEKKLRKYKGID